MDDNHNAAFTPKRRVADLGWGAFFLLVFVTVTLAVAAGQFLFYYGLFRNIGITG